MYIFASRRQLSFTISVSGHQRRVSFQEPNEGGGHLFTCKDPANAAAIRRHPYFKQGVIEEIGGQSEEELTVTTAQGEVITTAQGEVITAAPGATAQAEEVKEFENFTFAKEWLRSQYKDVTAAQVKTPELLQKKAQELGVNIKF